MLSTLIQVEISLKTDAYWGLDDVTLIGYDFGVVLQSEPITQNVPAVGGLVELGGLQRNERMCNNNDS